MEFFGVRKRNSTEFTGGVLRGGFYEVARDFYGASVRRFYGVGGDFYGVPWQVSTEFPGRFSSGFSTGSNFMFFFLRTFLRSCPFILMLST